MPTVHRPDIQVGEVRDTKYSRWCPFCHRTQMVVKGVKTTTDERTNLEQTTLVWKCPVCAEDFSQET